ncbi:MAG: metal-sensitive transcriptional regulator [Phycisphaerales bacterium]|jgi:DNA-binding FrmR family transcriptional regulator|nr:metal-sensitive transcriptional regulator [Phycisphaerales bacterium]
MAKSIRKRPPANAAKPTPARAGAPLDRLAAGIDPAARKANILQIKRARGQVDGIERMIDEDRYCADIIIQITAARASLQVVAKSLLAAHLKACHAAAIGNGGAVADQMYQELVDLVSKMAR